MQFEYLFKYFKIVYEKHNLNGKEQLEFKSLMQSFSKNVYLFLNVVT